MADGKTISSEKYARATAFIKKHVEPSFNRIVENVNLVFSKQGIRCGVELKWFFDEVEAENNEKDDDHETKKK